ncbi:hypothetical protein PIB30_011455 [Stylosanthes scabra]|uniref:Cystatin domain-containing protein n=1 Tax=Stylosanthes scabra TaxID=79078 RepID=A0ABU6R5S0_9FABA|nr:hypothetical protein [Stylosanthes scabra]
MDLKFPDLSMTDEELKAKYEDSIEPYSIVTPKVRYSNKAYRKMEEMDDEYMRLNRDRGPFDERVPHPEPLKSMLLGGVSTHTITDKNRDLLVELCNAALHKYIADTQGANFVFVELIRANRQLVNGFMYYITFDAIDATANCNDSAAAAHTTFQAKVCRCIRNEPPIRVIMCQIKPN